MQIVTIKQTMCQQSIRFSTQDPWHHESTKANTLSRPWHALALPSIAPSDHGLLLRSMPGAMWVTVPNVCVSHFDESAISRARPKLRARMYVEPVSLCQVRTLAAPITACTTCV